MAENNFNTIVIILVCMVAVLACFFLYLRNCCVVPRMPRRTSSAHHRSAAGSLTGSSLDPAVINSFPTYVYSEVKAHKILMGGLECAVCLNEFKDHETLRLLPHCSHTFHSGCIDKWLSSHITCPVCRADVTDFSYTVQSPINSSGEVSRDESARDTSHVSNSSNLNAAVDEIVIPIEIYNNQQIDHH